MTTAPAEQTGFGRVDLLLGIVDDDSKSTTTCWWSPDQIITSHVVSEWVKLSAIRVANFVADLAFIEVGLQWYQLRECVRMADKQFR